MESKKFAIQNAILDETCSNSDILELCKKHNVSPIERCKILESMITIITTQLFVKISYDYIIKLCDLGANLSMNPTGTPFYLTIAIKTPHIIPKLCKTKYHVICSPKICFIIANIMLEYSKYKTALLFLKDSQKLRNLIPSDAIEAYDQCRRWDIIGSHKYIEWYFNIGNDAPFDKKHFCFIYHKTKTNIILLYMIHGKLADAILKKI